MTMHCPKCGTQITEGDTYCGKCGTPVSNTGVSEPAVVSAPGHSAPAGTQRTSGFAIASLVLGILGISILAIVFGAIAIHQTGKDPYLSGRGLAIAGLVLGIIGFVGTIILIPFMMISSMSFL